LPAEAHDTEVISASSPAMWLRAAVPGTSSAFRQRPWTSLITNARPAEPPALQLPAEAHDTEVIPDPFLLRVAVPRTSSAFRQRPWTSLTTNARPVPDASS